MPRVLNPNWSICYERAISKDGSLLFPERLTREFLDQARRTMGTYFFANQYQNEILPEGEETFKKHWNRFYGFLPEQYFTFAFIDPAASDNPNADYTALTVVSAGIDKVAYVRHASRNRLNPTQIIELCFRVYDEFHPMGIGIEDVAFQKTLVHFAYEEMKRRNKMIPVTGIKLPSDKTKPQRIMSLVPWLEWGRLLFTQGLHDLELELAQFPRGAHDDVLDSLASCVSMLVFPEERKAYAEPNPQDAEYEQWYRKQLIERANSGEQYSDEAYS